MPYQLVTYTFYTSESGGYSYFGDYFSQANADVTGGGTSEDQFVAFNALQIEDAIASFSDGVDSVELSYKLSNNDIFQTQNITATDEYYASIGHQSLVEADTTNTSGESANSAADVFRDIDDSSGAYVGTTQTEGVKDTSVTENYDITSDVANAAAASRDLIVGFTIPQSEIGLTHVSNASITVTGFVPYDLPTVSDTDANQPITDDHSTRPFANVIIADPGNTSGNGDDVFITLLQNGNATSQLGALSLSPADTTAGQGLTDFGGGNYESRCSHIARYFAT